jgi:hypothetical protein
MTECWIYFYPDTMFFICINWLTPSIFIWYRQNRTSFNQNLDINNCMWYAPTNNMTVYPGMHCGCTLIVHRPLITLSKRRYVNEKTRYKTLISIPLELTYPVKIYLTILSTCGWQMSSEMLLHLVVILLFLLVSACSFESGMLFHWTLYSIQRNDITSEICVY